MKWYEFDIFITDIEPESYDITIDGANDLDFAIETDFNYDHDFYEGPYVVTPSQQEQILNTKDRLMNNNVTVEAISSCYGLITQNGHVLIVS